MFLKIAAALLAASPAAAGSSYGPWSPAQSEAIQRAAVVLATSSACRDIAPFSEARDAHAKFADAAMQAAGVPNDFAAEMAVRINVAEPIKNEPGADFVCRVILGEIS